MSGTTVVRRADWAVVWDPHRERHAYTRGIDVAFEPDRIIHTGPDYPGDAAHEIDGSCLLVLPGLIDIHSHPTLEPMHRGITEDVGSERLYGSSLYEYNNAFRPDPEGMEAAAEVAVAEAIQSGVTTLVDISLGVQRAPTARMVDAGVRLVTAPGFRCARWHTPDGHTVQYRWDRAAGRAGYEEALAFIEEQARHPSGRVTGMLAPMQIDTVSPDLLRESHAFARGNRLRWQVHAAQSVVEFLEIVRRHGVTPIQWLSELGVLDETTIVGHAMFVDHHSTSTWPTRLDLRLIADAGSSVAHCPTIFGRRGYTLEHFGSYVDAGVNVAIGTDSYPHNLLEEARHAAYFGRIAAGWVHALTTADIFSALTVNGARALGREDLGRLVPGARADLVLVDLAHPAMQPVRDPLKSLIFSAADRAVRDVYVAGEPVLRDGRALRVDVTGACRRASAAQRRAITRTPAHDHRKRSADELVPLTLAELR